VKEKNFTPDGLAQAFANSAPQLDGQGKNLTLALSQKIRLSVLLDSDGIESRCTSAQSTASRGVGAFEKRKTIWQIAPIKLMLSVCFYVSETMKSY